MTGHVDGDDTVRVGKRGDLRPPRFKAHTDPVDQQDRLARAFLEVGRAFWRPRAAAGLPTSRPISSKS